MKMLSLLVYPLTHGILAMLLALLALLFGRRGFAALVLSLGLAWLYLASCGGFGGWLAAWLESPYPPRSAQQMPSADAIVLLGGGHYARPAPWVMADLNEQADRLTYAADLYRQGKAPLIIVSGGASKGNPPGAELSAELLQLMGVPPGALLLESRSRTTYDNARFTAALLRERGIERVLLVTSALHMRRSVALFEARAIAVIAAATDHRADVGPGEALAYLPTLRGLSDTHYVMHELVGFLVYRYKGWL